MNFCGCRWSYDCVFRFSDRQWFPGHCWGYAPTNSTAELKDQILRNWDLIAEKRDHISVVIYTQATDVELECDGFLNYDRSDKFSNIDVMNLKKANQNLIAGKRNPQEASYLVVQ
jgi:hypothetical protein